MNNKRLDINQKHTGTGDNVVNVFSSELLLTAEWLKNQAKKAIINLGNRYTPTLNFELEQAQIFDGLGKTRFFQNQYTEKFDTLLTKGNQVLEGNSSISKEDIKKQYKQFIFTISSHKF